MFVRSSRVKAFLHGCKVMRRRYRDIVVRIERGWRERFKKRSEEYDRCEQRLQEVLCRLSSIRPEAYGHGEYGMVIRLDSRMLHMFHARDDERVIECWAQEVAHAFEREVRQLNFAKFGDLEGERQRAQAQEPRWGYGRNYH